MILAKIVGLDFFVKCTTVCGGVVCLPKKVFFYMEKLLKNRRVKFVLLKNFRNF